MKLNGICYQPAPSDFTPGHHAYFDSDYYNDDFEHLWSMKGRSDLYNMKQELSINFLHLYNWCTIRDHSSFLEECQRLGTRVGIPISNYTLGLVRDGQYGQAEQNIRNIVEQTLPYAPDVVVMWLIGNEYELEGFNIGHVMKVIELVVKYDTKNLRFSIPVSFKEKSLPTLREIKNAFDTHTTLQNHNHKLINCVNIFNKGGDITTFVSELYASEFRNTPLMLGEYGKDSHNVSPHEQSIWVTEQVKAVKNLTKSCDFFLGGCLFEYTEETWKPQKYDRHFGLFEVKESGQRETTRRCGHRYPVDTLVKKPVYDAIAKVIKDEFDGSCVPTTEPVVTSMYPSLSTEQVLPPPPRIGLGYQSPEGMVLPRPPVLTQQQLPPPPKLSPRLPRKEPEVTSQQTLPPPPKLSPRVPQAATQLPPPPKLPPVQNQTQLPPPPAIGVKALM
jgi:hypothetical protein